MADIEFPKVIDDDPLVISAEIIAEYERETDKKVFPAQTDRFMLNELTYRESLSKSQFNAAMQQNYVRWATGALLDALGEFWGVTRLTDETDEKFRIRIFLAPETLTTTGTRGAYEFHIRSVDPSISAVSFDNPNPGSGLVRSYILTDTGLPSDELLARVYKKLTDEKIAVLGVTYEVKAPEIVSYEFKATFTVKQGYDKQSVTNAVMVALVGITDENGIKTQSGFIDALENTLGADLIVSQFIDVIQSIQGVHSVTIITPDSDQILSPGQLPVNTLIDVTAVGEADEYN